MQYYSKLKSRITTIHHLSSSFDGIITLKDRKVILIWEKEYAAELILIRLANHLLCGKTNLFYEMLEILQSRPDDISDDLITEIRLVLDLTMPIGMKYSCKYSYALHYIIVSKGSYTHIAMYCSFKAHFSSSLDGYSIRSF